METKNIQERLRARLTSLALALGLILAPVVGYGQDCADSHVVEDFQQTLLSLAGLDYDARYERLAEPVRESHDLEATLRIATGRYWNELSAEQRSKLIDTFTQLSVATYADRFTIGEGASFETRTRQQRGGQTVVRSVLKLADKKNVQFDYVLHASDGQCRIVNIVADGVSDLALKRAEYTNVLGSKGFQALLDQLKGKVSEYGAPKG